MGQKESNPRRVAQAPIVKNVPLFVIKTKGFFNERSINMLKASDKLFLSWCNSIYTTTGKELKDDKDNKYQYIGLSTCIESETNLGYPLLMTFPITKYNKNQSIVVIELEKKLYPNLQKQWLDLNIILGGGTGNKILPSIIELDSSYYLNINCADCIPIDDNKDLEGSLTVRINSIKLYHNSKVLSLSVYDIGKLG